MHSFARFLNSLIVIAGLAVAPLTHDDDAPVSLEAPVPLPPRTTWRASSSAGTSPAMAPAMAIDGDTTTRWGGAFAAEHWLQVDLKSAADVGGVLLHWDSGFAASYRILTSVDGRDWQTVYETVDGQGGVDYVFFPPVRARYMRLASMPLSADWGVSVLEFEPLAAADAPRIEGLASDEPATPAAAVWHGSAAVPRALARGNTLTIQLPRPLPTTGVEVYWGEGWRDARLDARDERGRWQTLAVDRAPGNSSLLAARKPVTATTLRLRVGAAPRTTPAVRRLRLLPADRTMTPLRRYEVAASRTYRELFPLNVRNKQVYWTTLGIPAGVQKSIFDEFGNLEAWKGAPMVQPLWRDTAGTLHVAHGESPSQSLRDGWMPMPSVQWVPEDGLLLRSEAITVEESGQPVTLLRHRLQNTGQQPISGDLLLLVRPVQINPAWQSGGISPIREVALEGPSEDTAIRVNRRLLLRSLTPVHTRGASGFGTRGEGELTQALASNVAPTTAKARDDDGLAAAYLRYPITLVPGEQRDVVIAFPLGNKHIEEVGGTPPEPPPLDRASLMGQAQEAGEAFDALATEVAAQWAERIGRVGLSLPDRALVDTLRAQVAYMLINQTGPAMQPGPRNYSRSFIRDGSATALTLLRMGMADRARDYLRWYTDHALHDNGLVSPILNEDGTVNRGFGSDLEHDSQGQFVSLVADVARLDGGPQTVREYLPKVRLALRFLKQLRERTLVDGYLAEREAPERFRGLIAPSISHEGYSVPTHSYWDDFWGLKGWEDGAWLAGALGNTEMQKWARTEYEALHASVVASVRATMAWRKSDTAPSSADLGEYDPTSTSIGLDPCGQMDVFPPDVLQHTFDLYLDSVRKRLLPGSLWAYTPYEFRNVLTYVHLDRPRDAYELLENLFRHRRPSGWHVFAEVIHSRLRHPGYLGDMPHTWIGAEYARTIFGLLMHEADDRLELLPGAPQKWLLGEGISVSDLRTARGRLTMTARHDGSQLSVQLGPGLNPDTPVYVTWPLRLRPDRVWVDGELHSDQTTEGILLARPFKQLVARW